MTISDDTLTLYFYTDGLSRRERQEVAAALQTDRALGARYAALSAELQQLTDAPAVDAPADLVQRLHDCVDRLAELPAAAPDAARFNVSSFFWGAALAATLAIGIFIGITVTRETPDLVVPRMAEVPAPMPPTTSPFVRGLRVHLQNSERGLSGLPPGDAERALLLMNIIEQNRLFERAAVQNDADNLARVLRAFELVLARLAAGDLDAEETDALRNKLLFELNVVLTKLSAPPSTDSQTI